MSNIILVAGGLIALAVIYWVVDVIRRRRQLRIWEAEEAQERAEREARIRAWREWYEALSPEDKEALDQKAKAREVQEFEDTYGYTPDWA